MAEAQISLKPCGNHGLHSISNSYMGVRNYIPAFGLSQKMIVVYIRNEPLTNIASNKELRIVG